MEMVKENELTDFLNASGVKCKCVGTQTSANFFRIEYDLADVQSLKRLERILPSFNLLMKTKAQIVESQVAHIGLLFPKQDREMIMFDEYGLDTKPNEIVFGITSDNKPLKRTFGDDISHLLIAGATGSGKSVMLNSIIMQLALNTKSVGRIMCFIDLKKVELDIYKQCKEFSYNLATTIVDAMTLLKGLCITLDERYTQMQSQGTRKWKGGKIYLVVDELAELVSMCEQSTYYLSKIARMGRACGIHLILATQRPEAKICKGQMLSNITTRVALQTSSARESVMILGHKGAESLLGKGDAIVKLGDTNEEVRVQGLSIDEKYIKKHLGR